MQPSRLLKALARPWAAIACVYDAACLAQGQPGGTGADGPAEVNLSCTTLVSKKADTACYAIRPYRNDSNAVCRCTHHPCCSAQAVSFQTRTRVPVTILINLLLVVS